MPLKLWLPLDGTSENRGISGVTMSGSPASWGNGRTGKCAVFNDNTANYILYQGTDYRFTVEDFSWAFWLKKDFSSKTASNMWAFTLGRAAAGGYGYGLKVTSTTGVMVQFGSATWDVAGIPDNTWHHIAFTRHGTKVGVYVDGILQNSTDFSGTVPTYTEALGLSIGTYYYKSGTATHANPLIGAISDFRIYDHTLSAKEVYEISRGLILHYPLSAPGNANPNLLTWTKNYTAATPLVHTSSAKDGYKYLGDDSLITVTPGKVYYVQMKSDGTLSSSHASGAGVVSDKFTFWFYIRNTGTSKNVGQYDQTTCFTSEGAFINDPGRQLYVWKWTAPSNAQDITLRTNSYSDGSTAVTLHFWDFKIEEETYTGYVPSKNSAQYGELGYGSDIVRDATGRGNDGQLYTTAPTFVAGSPRYATCASFGSGSCIWPIPDPIKSDTAEFSIAVWFKTTTTSGNQCIWNGRTTTGAAVAIFLIGNTLRVDDSAQTTSSTVSTNTWYHLAVTWKSGGSKVIYLNGEQKTSVSAGTLSKSNTKASIGRPSSADSIASSNYFSGQMSDFRIYGTALSADDVKYLYRTSAAIDNSGDMFAESFEETELKPRVGSEGLVYGSHLTESGGTIAVYQNTSKGLFDPNTKKWSYVPAADTNNSCMDFGFFCPDEGVTRYHITMVVEWSGFADILTTNPDFTINFHGPNYIIGGTTYEWTGNPISTALYAVKTMQSLVTGADSGSYKYEADFTLTSGWLSSYWACYVGFRTNYSNGTGKITASKLRIYPADEHMTNSASLCSSGAIQVRLADEVHLA